MKTTYTLTKDRAANIAALYKMVSDGFKFAISERGVLTLFGSERAYKNAVRKAESEHGVNSFGEIAGRHFGAYGPINNANVLWFA